MKRSIKFYGMCGLLLIVAAVLALLAACSSQPATTLAKTSSAAVSTTPAASTATSIAPASSAPATSAAAASASPSAARVRSWTAAPAMQISTSKKYTANVDTSLGSFKIQLLPQDSPKTVNNFVFLSRQGFYDSVIFHRIIKAFMIQTGDPQGTGMGGPGYKFADELPPKYPYGEGIVAMANSGPNTNGSQFFICTGASSTNLNNMPNYTQFGKISEGMDVVQKIAGVTVTTSASGEKSKPVTPPVINSITITEQ